jgi:hypothetical protein
MRAQVNTSAIRAQAESRGCTYTEEQVVWSGYRTYREANHDLLGKHYGEWVRKVQTMGLLSPEVLTPRLTVPYHERMPHAMALADEARTKHEEGFLELTRQEWGYYFYLGGGSSTLGDEEAVANSPPKRTSKLRSLHRMRLIVDGLQSMLGSFDGATTLDMACNWGGFSLECAARGASVVGVDLRAANVAKANMLRSYLGIPNANFQEKNVYSLPNKKKYDIVLNLGLLYHVTKQWELVKKTYDICRSLAVIETVTHLEPFSGFLFGSGRNIPAVHAAGEIPVELHPTYRGLIDMMLAVGFKQILELDTVPDPNWAGFSNDVFGKKLRRCLVGFK